ncbi:diacylglycerol kinase [Burkholderia guangdongensis]|uniref:diacylglycerol kinase n=1 Tax=Burkholderia guangdongensis TaxID=1792500 RepID=UPI0015CE21C8|nr:diacylglycerol kinase [Burkholderia guangdongensis]
MKRPPRARAHRPASPARAAPAARHRPYDEEDPHPETDVPEPPEPLGPDDPLTPLPPNPYKGNRGFVRAWYALKHSVNGFKVAIREESAFRQELTLAALMLPIGAFSPVPAASRALLIGSVLLVLIVELLNSSVEAAIDRISLERHELSKRAKDLGSAAVTVALFACVTTWGFVLGPVVLHWLRTR